MSRSTLGTVTALTACGMDLIFSSSSNKEQLSTHQIQSELEDTLESHDSMYQLTHDDIKINYLRKLGEGAFCTVYPVHIRNKNKLSDKEDAFQDKVLPPFALKKVRYDLVQLQEDQPGILQSAYEDLVQEASIMKQLLHSNILQMIGCSIQDTTKMDKYFIIIEQLDTTLDHRLKAWAKNRGRKNTPKESVLLRIQEVAIPIASALEYMHHPAQSILYRDLKPANIGFDASGRVKLFDFGLAIKLEPNQTLKRDAGTLRYMAPEMRMGKEYSYPADMYSYAILLWQILTARTPLEKEIPESDFFGINPKSIPQDKRPNLKYIEQPSISTLLGVIWDTDPKKRLSFKELIPELHKIAKVMEAECGSPNSKLRKGRPGLGPKRRSMLSSMNNY